MDNLKLRQAVQYAIDREAIAKALGGGNGIVQYYDYTPGTVGYSDKLPHYSFDLDKAKQLFAESGAKAPLDIRLTVITREADQQQAQLIQAMLQKIGINVKIEGLERVAWGQQVRQNNDFEMATQLTGNPVDPDTISLVWQPDGPAVYTRANEPAVLSCLTEGRGTTDPAARQPIYEKCQQLMYDVSWWGYMWLQPYNYLTNKKVGMTSAPYQSEWREEAIWLTS
jgi:peptide/nickel transport system substrate-binding protein